MRKESQIILPNYLDSLDFPNVNVFNNVFSDLKFHLTIMPMERDTNRLVAARDQGWEE